MKKKKPARKSSGAIVTPLPSLKPGAKWLPVEGEQARGILTRSGLDSRAQERLIDSAAEILGRGVNPKTGKGSATGLVVGYVQSGKTLSFTTVIGLARDNGFALVIVVAGNKDNLLKQSHDRLAKDLNVNGGTGLPAWKLRKNVRANEANDEQLIRQSIKNWKNEELEEDERSTLLLTVLKQNQRLQNLTTLLSKVDLRGVPVLVIDDEADQASLNTRAQQGEESTTHTRLRELRDVLPCHTYLQYTATPQAPLLINIADTLSPDFVHVLAPGKGYVGGKEFFVPGSRYVDDIPAADITPDKAPLPNDPPDSLLEALRVFFVGLGASLLSPQRSRRSMLIHPSVMRSVHRGATTWVTEAKEEWERTLKLRQSDADRKALISDFKRAYDELSTTVTGIPAFEDIVSKLPRALRNTYPIEFNTNGRPKTPEIEWRDGEGWILVGGQAIDRGFTVDSLTVTYMPRGVGMGNADTLQQRARFFGYKRAYLGYCRIYLEAATRNAFEEYVEHEEIMRRELEKVAKSGASLRDWRRRFILSADLQPCRRSVISDPLARGSRAGGWTQQRGALLVSEAMSFNSSLLEKLLDDLVFSPDSSYPSGEKSQQHLIADAPLKEILELLVAYRFQDPRDTAAFTGLLVSIGAGLDRQKGLRASVYRMRPNASGSRTVTSDGTLNDGFQQGPTRSAGGGFTYPGDAFFKAPDRVSIQLHTYELRDSGKKVLAQRAPLIAVHIPRRLAKEWLVQVQQGQSG